MLLISTVAQQIGDGDSIVTLIDGSIVLKPSSCKLKQLGGQILLRQCQQQMN